MWTWIVNHTKTLWISFVFGTLILCLTLALRWVDKKNDRIAELATKLISTEQTLEIEKGLFARKSLEAEDLKDLLSKLGEDNAKLQKLIDDAQSEILTLNTLVIKWRKAYYVVLNGSQTETPPPVPGDPPRVEVTFDGRAGPLRLWGSTKTNPPQAFLNWEQIDPLKLTVAVVRNRDGTYSTIVNSPDLNVQADITFSGTDPSVLRPKWYQRVWVDFGVEPLGTKGAQAGLSYRMDRWSLGAYCHVDTGEGRSCGLSAGFRLFK